MKMKFRAIFISWILALVIANALNAMTILEEEKIHTNISIFYWNLNGSALSINLVDTSIKQDYDLQGLYFKSKNDYQEIKVNIGDRTDDFTYEGSRTFTLYKKKVVQAVAEYIPIHSVQIEGKSDRYMLMLQPDHDKFITNIISIPTKILYPPKAMIINLSRNPLAVQLHLKEYPSVIQPLEQSIITLKPNERSIFQILVTASKDEEWERVLRRRLPLYMKHSYIMILFENTEQNYNFLYLKNLPLDNTQ